MKLVLSIPLRLYRRDGALACSPGMVGVRLLIVQFKPARLVTMDEIVLMDY